MSNRTLRVGLTGGLAGGKSTVAEWLRDAGFEVIDAFDRLVAELYRPGGEGPAAVRDLFGPEMLDADGAVDHHRLAERIFGDAAARARLEAAIHPLVRKLFVAQTANLTGVVVLEATLLIRRPAEQARLPTSWSASRPPCEVRLERAGWRAA